MPGTVGRVLDRYLEQRLARATAADAVFAADVALRVADFTRGGGRRMRGQLLWWTMRACGREDGPVGTALAAAAALELLQTCALVQDDVMDRAATRRGRRALHLDVAAQYASGAGSRGAAELGSAAGVLAGDLALVWADDLAAAAQEDLPPHLRDQVRQVWSDLRTEMIAGQYADLHGQVTRSRTPGRALRIARLKSAMYSVERPVHLGAVLAGANPEQVRELRRAGRCAGIAFQLRDDLDGVFGDPARTGKPCGDDIRSGKPTYLLAVAHARAVARQDLVSADVLERCPGDADLDDGAMEEVRRALVRTGARAAVQSRIERLSARSAEHLERARPAGPGADRLADLLRAAAGLPPRGAHRTGATR
ncbi:polyprenyl synthetase family protein [Kitasatospora cineracea]|uniref:Geranylgeranyl diphosphate synthase type I n=1 Tax=Kitasatospora cineracea TaxID=88074 RepID=A0A3N4SKM0_9ACTN|nr:polyprenyl synthetase family protein [Kitasatospora cineracea]RPE37104.1 geranylgeranyl diphosphate synthase type I [Kitasatospora cineracea]